MSAEIHPEFENIVNCQTQTNAGLGNMNIWHLIRTSNVNSGQSTYSWVNNGAHADVYILDTGIDTDHPEFTNNRAHHEYVAPLLAGQGFTDRHGHGTHVASLTGGNIMGIAKSCQLYNIKVLGDNGSGSTGGIVSGIQHSDTRYEMNLVAYTTYQ